MRSGGCRYSGQTVLADVCEVPSGGLARFSLVPPVPVFSSVFLLSCAGFLEFLYAVTLHFQCWSSLYISTAVDVRFSQFPAFS